MTIKYTEYLSQHLEIPFSASVTKIEMVFHELPSPSSPLKPLLTYISAPPLQPKPRATPSPRLSYAGPPTPLL